MVEQHLAYAARIVVGTLLAGVIGFERDAHGRPAGLKTHVLVGLASSTFMVVSTQLWDFQGYHAGQTVALDPSRIAAAVVTGVGFLGGGAILRTGLGVLGLTTAAGLWLVAAIGLCAGGGLYAEAVLVTVLGLLALTMLRRLEHPDEFHRHMVLRCGGDPQARDAIARQLEKLSVSARELNFERKDGAVELTLDLRCSGDIPTKDLVAGLEEVEGLLVISVGHASGLR